MNDRSDDDCNARRRAPRSTLPRWLWWVAGGAALVWLGNRPSATASAALATTSATPAEWLRAVVFPTPGADRPALVRAYQSAEQLPASGAWDEATAAKAELRLSDFGAAARAGLVAAMQRDALFRRS